MDSIKKMNDALNYIEENLDNEIDFKEVARLAFCSEYHFQRMFSFLAGTSLSEYIRRRRLTLAGFELKNSDIKIIDLAYKYGYDSPNSFTRAFQLMHGVTPSEARTPRAELKAFAPISFLITIKGGTGLNYRIVEEVASTVFGVTHITNVSDAYETIPAFIDKCEEQRITNKIVEASHGNERTLLKSVLYDMDNDMMAYMLCLDMPEDEVLEGFDTMVIPESKWAVFPLVIEKPEDSIVSIWKRIFTEWFPNSGYELDSGPRQERCYWREDGKMIVEAWVPVVKVALK
jgi:AraC family transcriptional regulator